MVKITTFNIKQGEAKRLKFTIKQDNSPLDCSTGDCSFTVKRDKGQDDSIINKIDMDFDKSEAEQGILYLTLYGDDTNIDPDIYQSELRIEFSLSSILKSNDIVIKIVQAVNPL